MTDTEQVRLTEWTTCGGCAAKWGATLLGGLVDELGREPSSDGLLVGLAPYDDAAVYQLSSEVALVSTTDFFPPLVDDPNDFGAIAAANACSDVFAMGGRVLLALNIAAFPEALPMSAITEIFEGAATVVAEAGGVVAGGHTIRSEEPIFGLAVQGVVRPGEQLTKGGARAGDRLILSKPLGTGIALASGDPRAASAAVHGMRSLNRRAAEALTRRREAVHAVTDVTGFGLFGHAFEIAERSEVALVLEHQRLPVYEGVLEAARAGARTGGDARNRDHLVGRVAVEVDEALASIAFDPQTSGGLLAAVDANSVEAFAAAEFVDIGGVETGRPRVALR
jgi:selenide,water dikinase